MGVSTIAAKLQALRNYVAEWLGDPQDRRHKRFFDYQLSSEVIDRYVDISKVLRAKYPSHFQDLPVRKKPRNSGTTEFDGHGYIPRSDLELLLRDINYCIDVLSKVPIVSDSSIRITREGIFFAGQYFDALQQISDFFSQAENDINIIDNYIDENVLKLATSKKSVVKINILTKKVSPALHEKAMAFNKQYGGLSIRTSDIFHDRFLMIDSADLYHLGASIKDLGRRGFMFSKIEEPIVMDMLLHAWTQEWQQATAIM